MANKRKINKNLVKRVIDLENQLFAQKLVIDELESKLEVLEAKIPDWFSNPYGGSGGVQIIYPTNYPPNGIYTTAADMCTLPDGSVVAHDYVLNSNGHFTCANCGKSAIVTTTVSANTGAFTGNANTSGVLSADNIVLT